MRIAPKIELTSEDKTALTAWANGRKILVRVAERAPILLLADENKLDIDIASELSITPEKAARWRKRFLAKGLADLEKDAPRPGRTPSIAKATVDKVVRLTTQEKPANATHWSMRTMAAAGISESSILRIWHAHGLKPHRIESFKLSNDPNFTQKLETIVALYLEPPEHAIVVCVDEKSQVQALDRTQPGLPMKKERELRRSHLTNAFT